jgi:uncharacterized iron-regulated membrane protein
MSVAAGVVCNALVLAMITGLDMPAQRRRAARGQSHQHAPLIGRHAVEKGQAMPSNYVRQLQRRADCRHDWPGSGFR